MEGHKPNFKGQIGDDESSDCRTSKKDYKQKNLNTKYKL